MVKDGGFIVLYNIFSSLIVDSFSYTCLSYPCSVLCSKKCNYLLLSGQMLSDKVNDLNTCLVSSSTNIQKTKTFRLCSHWSRRLAYATHGGGGKRSWPLVSPTCFFYVFCFSPTLGILRMLIFHGPS